MSKLLTMASARPLARPQRLGGGEGAGGGANKEDKHKQKQKQIKKHKRLVKGTTTQIGEQANENARICTKYSRQSSRRVGLH